MTEKEVREFFERSREIYKELVEKGKIVPGRSVWETYWGRLREEINNRDESKDEK